MSRRSFTRRFHRETGTTIWTWLLQQRLALARRLLETTDRSIDLIATDVGFGSALPLRQHFRSVLGTSPFSYRRTFRGA